MPLVFGPVPSRRLGQSLGINNLPGKLCSYACGYCQAGDTPAPQVDRRDCHEPAVIVSDVTARLAELGERGRHVDVLSFVPNGEPTLDRRLGEAIAALERCEIPVAVITNGSLLWRADVRADLALASIVSVKVDTTSEIAWKHLDGPCAELRLAEVLAGITAFAAEFRGRLLTETMLIADVNDDAAELADTAAFVASLAPAVAYLCVPTRPTSRPGVRAASEVALARAYASFSPLIDSVECLAGYDDTPFAGSADLSAQLLAITAVHPMRIEEVAELLASERAPWSIVAELEANGQLVRVQHDGRVFVVRTSERWARRREQ